MLPKGNNLNNESFAGIPGSFLLSDRKLDETRALLRATTHPRALLLPVRLTIVECTRAQLTREPRGRKDAGSLLREGDVQPAVTKGRKCVSGSRCVRYGFGIKGTGVEKLEGSKLVVHLMACLV